MEYFAEKWNLSTSWYKDAVYKIWSKLKVIFELWHFKLVIFATKCCFLMQKTTSMKIQTTKFNETWGSYKADIVLLLSRRLVKLTDTKILILSLNIFQISNSKFQIFSCELLRQVKKSLLVFHFGFQRFEVNEISILSNFHFYQNLGL